MDRPIRVVVADDDDLLRALIRRFVEEHDALEWGGEAATAQEAIAACALSQPDVAIVDVRMPGGGPEAVEGIMQQSPEPGSWPCRATAAWEPAAACSTRAPTATSSRVGRWRTCCVPCRTLPSR